MRLNRLWLWSSKVTVVVAVVEADTALAEAATSANDGDSGNDDGSDKGGWGSGDGSGGDNNSDIDGGGDEYNNGRSNAAAHCSDSGDGNSGDFASFTVKMYVSEKYELFYRAQS